ncbi:AAA domain-containing protein [Russula dissimulans]|nr:AAA domain-containing protein [Russula dissimulans]
MPHTIALGKMRHYRTRCYHGRSDTLFRAASRVPSQGRKHRLSCDGKESRRHIKRLIPPQLETQPDERFYHELKAYEDRFLPLLELEQAEEEKEVRERLAKWPVKRLCDQGYCITGMSAFWLDSKFGNVATFGLGPGIILPDNKLEGGTSVLVTRLDPLREKPTHGRVLSRTSTQLRVSFQKLFDLEDQLWRLDLGQSNIAYERMCHAVTQLHQDPRALEKDTSNPESELVLLGTHIRDVILRSFSPTDGVYEPQPFQAADDASYAAHDTLDHPAEIGAEHWGIFKDDMRIQSWARRHLRVNPVRVEGDPELYGLNATQIRAIAMMVGQRITLIHGPPGTGKSKTIIEAVRLLKADFEVPVPILVCTYTNMALDHIVDGLVRRGLKPLRVGLDAKVQPALKDYVLEAYLDKHPRRGDLERLVSEETRLQEKVRVLERNIEEAKARDQPNRLASLRTIMGNVDRQLWVVKTKLFKLRQEMITDVLKQVDVSQHVVLIGDHKQLPPVIRSREAQIRGLNISLFERLTEEGVVPSIMLDMQYRMHPEISRFPSSEFYARSLKDGTVDSGGNVHAWLQPPVSEHLVVNSLTGDRPSVVFLDHDGLEAAKDRSRINVTDAAIVCAVLEDLLRQNEDLRGEDIGVISPYIAQISLLNYLINIDPDYRNRFRNALGPNRVEELAQIEVKTVNGFEGRQKEVVLFSTVRNNAAGALGFLADRRRLNVGLTRARRGLFVIGGLATLRAGSSARGAVVWKHYADFLAGAQLVRPLKGCALRQVLDGPGRVFLSGEGPSA